MNISSVKKNLLADLLVKTSHQRVLAFFIARPSGQLYGTEIADKIGISIAQLSKVLNTLISIEPRIERLKGNTSRRVALYDSCANGMNIESSDLDLLVVSTKKDDVRDIIFGFPVDESYGFSEIRAVVKTPAEWAALEEQDPGFHNEILRGVSLYEKGINESRL